MNKQDVVDFVAGCSGLTKVQAKRCIDCYHEAIQGAMKTGDSVTIAGFGSFKVAARRARRGRNPQTGKEINIPARNVPKFVPGKALKDAVR